MDRINHPTADENNLFRSRDIENKIPGTKVTKEWLNNVQEEICSFIESMGLDLDGEDQTQLYQAIRENIFNHSTIVEITNNQNGVNIPGASADKTVHKHLKFEYLGWRKDSLSSKVQKGEIHLLNDGGAWRKEGGEAFGDDIGTDFEISEADGVVQIAYNSDNFEGSDYDSELRFKVYKF